MKKLLVVIVVSLIGLSSCTKDNDPATPVARPANFGEIKANESFDWSNEKTITINIKGNPTIETVTSALTISTVDGNPIKTMLHQMDQDASFTVVIPADQTSIKMKYGSIEKTATVSNQVEFNFLPTLID